MRRAFTLIELLLVVAILSTMVTVGVMGINSSRMSISSYAAARDVMAIVRRARAVALVTQKPVVVEYSNETIDDETYAMVEVKSEKLFSSKAEAVEVRNLAGEIVSSNNDGDESELGEGEGETLADVLSPKGISSEVTKGLKIRVLPDSELDVFTPDVVKKSKISIFSTADSISRSYDSDTKKKDQPLATASSGGDAETKEEEGDDSPVKVVFAANGTIDPPHKIWIYPDGSQPEKGICISVDRFGEPRCEDVE